MKRTIRDLAELQGKVVLCRVEFNVPIDEAGRILDATRIIKAIPTIEYLSQKGAKVVLLSHLGRPNGYDIRQSLWPIAVLLMKKIKASVTFCNSVIGDEVKDRINAMKNGDVLLLENVRFYKGESECDMKFAKQIASLGQIFVDDAFGVAHRENASNFGIARLLPNAIGFLMEKELNALTTFMEKPKRPFVAVLGGSKVESKIKILNRFIEVADVLLIGGAMAYAFISAQGKSTGLLNIQRENVEIAKEILEKAQALGKKILLPVDHACVRESDPKKNVIIVENIAKDMIGYDIGPKTIKLFSDEIAKAGQIFWNGPMGVFEKEQFAAGTIGVCKAIASLDDCMSVIGGGDSASAAKNLGYADKFTHISTGGGASLEYMEGKELPGIAIIEEK